MAQDTEEEINEKRREARSQRSYRGARAGYTREKTKFLKETRERSGRREIERAEDRRAREQRRIAEEGRRAAREQRGIEEQRRARRRGIRRSVTGYTMRGFRGIESTGKQFFRAPAVRNPKSLILTELLFVFVVITIYEIQVKKRAPKPSSYIGSFFLFLMLAFVAQVNREFGRVAAVFGGLVVIAILMTPLDNPRANIFSSIAEFLSKGQQQQRQEQQQNQNIPNIPPPPADNVVDMRNFSRAGVPGRM